MTRETLRGWGRLAALAAAATALIATSYPHCVSSDAGSFEAATSCGPAATVRLSYDGATYAGGCGGEDGCYGYLQAPGASAAGLPEQGEIHPVDDPAYATTATPPSGSWIAANPFALVGDAPVAGTSPAAHVRRTCRGVPTATPGLVRIDCTSDAPGGACSGTLTLVPPAQP